VEAIRIADAEARTYYHQLPLYLYEHWPVHRYESGRWYIGYRQHSKKFADFGVEVHDKRRKAWIVIPY
jgi:hypothetical protein